MIKNENLRKNMWEIKIIISTILREIFIQLFNITFSLSF